MKRTKDLPEFSRPREKLKERGASALSDEELIAAILGSGTEKNEVMTIASRVSKLLKAKNGKPKLEDLYELDGMGFAKASQILASIELSRRYTVKDIVKINEPEDILPLVLDIAGKKQEYFICISLNGANEVVEKRVVTIGLVDRSPVHPREVFAEVITDRAASVIFVHNHPSGELKPSEKDLKIHEQLTEAGKILGINIVDHLIIAKKGYYSFQKEGLIH